MTFASNKGPHDEAPTTSGSGSRTAKVMANIVANLCRQLWLVLYSNSDSAAGDFG